MHSLDSPSFKKKLKLRQSNYNTLEVSNQIELLFQQKSQMEEFQYIEQFINSTSNLTFFQNIKHKKIYNSLDLHLKISRLVTFEIKPKNCELVSLNNDKNDLYILLNGSISLYFLTKTNLDKNEYFDKEELLVFYKKIKNGEIVADTNDLLSEMLVMPNYVGICNSASHLLKIDKKDFEKIREEIKMYKLRKYYVFLNDYLFDCHANFLLCIAENIFPKVQVRKGNKIFSCGEPCEHMYILYRGEISGELFGDLDFFGENNYRYTAVASQRSSYFVFTKELFHNIKKARPDLVKGLKELIKKKKEYFEQKQKETKLKESISYRKHPNLKKISTNKIKSERTNKHYPNYVLSCKEIIQKSKISDILKKQKENPTKNNFSFFFSEKKGNLRYKKYNKNDKTNLENGIFALSQDKIAEANQEILKKKIDFKNNNLNLIEFSSEKQKDNLKTRKKLFSLFTFKRKFENKSINNTSNDSSTNKIVNSHMQLLREYNKNHKNTSLDRRKAESELKNDKFELNSLNSFFTCSSVNKNNTSKNKRIEKKLINVVSDFQFNNDIEESKNKSLHEKKLENCKSFYNKYVLDKLKNSEEISLKSRTKTLINLSPLPIFDEKDKLEDCSLINTFRQKEQSLNFGKLGKSILKKIIN